MTRVAIDVLSLAVVAAALVCCKLPSKRTGDGPTPPASAPSPPTSRSAPSEDGRFAPSAVRAHASDLKAVLSEYRDNEVRANAKYQGRFIALAGTVDTVRKGQPGAYVTIGTGAVFEMPVFQCYAAQDQEADFSALSKGQRIIVAGRVSGLRMNVVADECVIEPGMKLCRKVQQAVGAGRCEKLPQKVRLHAAAYLRIGTGHAAVGVTTGCAADAVEYQKVKDSGEQVLCSDRTGCYLVVFHSPRDPIPPELLGQLQRAVEAMP
jgi:hypothetical protein